MQLRALAEKLGGTLVGDGDIEIARISTIELAGPGDLTFLANSRYESFLTATKAGAVIVDKPRSEHPLNYIVHANPYFAFSQALKLLHPQPGSQLRPGIAATAVVDSTVTLGENTHIGNFVEIGADCKLGRDCKIMSGAVIGRNCQFGDNCLIYPNVTIYDDTVIGNNVSIHAGTVIGSDGFGYATEKGVHHKVYQVGRVRIESDVEIGANCTVDRAALGETVIGEGTKIDNLVQIAHNVKIGRGCIVVSQVGIAGSTTIGNYVVLAGQAGIVGHLNIPDRVTIAAQAGVSGTLKEGTVYAGSPQRELKEFKILEAHLSRLPERMAELKKLKSEVEELKAKLAAGNTLNP